MAEHEGIANADYVNCEHFWVSHHQGGMRIWIRQCQFCDHFDTADVNEQVKEVVNDEVVGRYHPEFGTEWQEGGSLSEIIRAAQEQAFDFGLGAGISYGSDPSLQFPTNPYRKES